MSAGQEQIAVFDHVLNFHQLFRMNVVVREQNEKFSDVRNETRRHVQTDRRFFDRFQLTDDVIEKMLHKNKRKLISRKGTSEANERRRRPEVRS